MEFLTNTWISVQNSCAPAGNFASVAGLLVSLFGFYWTIRSVTTARRAARQAEIAANAARESILKSGAVAKFSEAIGLMEEVKRLQRKKEWGVLLDRYAELRRVLIELKSEAIGLEAEEQGTLGGVIAQLNTIEKKVDEALTGGKVGPDIVKINAIVSKQIVKVHELSTKFKMK
jgi:hypothetical protein